MTAPADIFGSQIYDVPRQRSRCKILVYSHIRENPDDKEYNGIIDCSPDVIQCRTSKTLKGGGGASFTLVPRKNYLNYIYPNDYVHIYFDPGDGRGFIRTFFGFIDRCERSIQTGEGGRTVTRYNITCSDFTKAFDKTNIYFNPHIVDRGDFVSQHFAGTKAIAGAALRTKGVSVSGTPADIVMSLITLILGFGSQFSIPKSHPIDKILVDLSRKQRLKNVLGQLSSEFQTLLGEGELEKAKETIQAQHDVVKGSTARALSEPFIAGSKAAPGLLFGLQALPENVQHLLLRKAGLQEEVSSDRFNRAVQASKTAYSPTHSLLDMMDFSFVEHAAIDGSILSTQIWQSQGPLWTIMNSWSNDMVNELFCDLRLVGKDQKFDFSEGDYSRQSDEIHGNEGPGVRTVPALVMREHPFSVIEGVVPPGQVTILGSKLPGVPFAGISLDGKSALYTRGIEEAGRKVSTITALNPFLIVESKGKAKAQKHLDVAVISVKDIISEQIGRSDSDTVNLIEVYADIGIGSTGKFFANEIQPVSNPISVMRNGLRVRTYTTKFARWPASKYAKDKGGIDSKLTRFQTVRWSLMLDHWYQHAIEYLNGSITTRAFPEIRVGYRLDIKERNESYYVEGTNHDWQYTDTGAMLTSSFTLSRGQRNDPFPVYVLPSLPGWGGTDARDDESRLSVYFHQRNPSAVTRSSIQFGERDIADNNQQRNMTDIPKPEGQRWIKRKYLSAGSDKLSSQKRDKENEENRHAWTDLGVTDAGLVAGQTSDVGESGRNPPTGKRDY